MKKKLLCGIWAVVSISIMLTPLGTRAEDLPENDEEIEFIEETSEEAECDDLTGFIVNSGEEDSEREWYKDFSYMFDSNKMLIKLSKYKGSASAVYIPSTVKMNIMDEELVYTVYLNGSVFMNADSLEEITISPGVKLAGNSSDLFYGCRALKTLVINGVDTSELADMSGMFSGCRALTELDLSYFGTQNVTNMESLFNGCRNIKNLDLSGFDTENVTDMSGMFLACSSLESVDVSSFNTGKVERMDSMFDECKSLSSLDLSGFNTESVKLMSFMFNKCDNLSELKLTSFNTGNTTDMSCMFAACKSLESVDISSFNTEKLINMSGMFANCFALKNLDLSSFDLSKIEDMNDAFQMCAEVGEFKTPLNLPDTIEVKLPTDMTNVYSSFVDEEGKEYTKIPHLSYSITLKRKDPNAPKPGPDPEPKPSVVSDNSPMSPVAVIDEGTKDLYLVEGQRFYLPESDWISLNNKNLSVNGKNLVSAKRAAAAPIGLTKGKRSIDVHISKPVMAKKSLTMQAGSEQAIGFSYDKEHLAVQWYSNAPDIATVSDEGKVTAVGKGTATITAYVNGKAYTCKVKVLEDIPAEERTLHITVNTSKKVSIKGIKNVTWVSDDEKIAGVTKKNKVTANAVGETVIRTEYQGKEYRIRVFVENPVITTKGIQSNGKNKYKLELKQGATSKIVFSSLEQSVIFKSNKGEIAHVEADGTIVANKTGKAVLTTKINGKKITINVTVK